MRGPILGIKFPYSQSRPGGRFRYRRPVPPELQAIVGKDTLTRALGASKKEAIGNWGTAHREIEAILAAARRTLAGDTGHTDGLGDSDLANHLRVERRLREAGFDPHERPTDETDPRRSLLADEIVDSLPIDPDTGEAIISGHNLAFVRALNNGLGRQPVPTLKDAARLYVGEKAKGDTRKEKADRQRVDRVMAKALDVLGGDRPIDRIRLDDALKIRDRLLADYKTRATARRYLAPLKALVAYALWRGEHNKTVTDPFSGVTVVVDGNPMDDRRPFTDEELTAIRGSIRASANADLLDIWTVLEFTGCRLSEVRGLGRSEVFLDEDIPYIAIRWTSDRRLKTKASDRDIPLHPEAVAALRRALGRAGGGRHVFPAFMYDGAGEALSGALMRHVRVVTDDPLAAVHSLRHNMLDWLLTAAPALADLTSRLLGHGNSGDAARMRKTYGGRRGLLRAQAEMLAMAFPEMASSAPQDAPDGPPAASL